MLERAHRTKPIKTDCDGNRVKKAKKTGGICCATFLVYVFTMASQAGCEVVNSDADGSISTLFKKGKYIMFKNL